MTQQEREDFGTFLSVALGPAVLFWVWVALRITF